MYACTGFYCRIAGFDTEHLGTAVWKGGETEALSRLDRHLERKVITVNLRTNVPF